MSEHRWSGWPGAWCLDCGAEDEREVCCAVHLDGLVCVEGHVMCEEGHPMKGCTEHVNSPCTCPGAAHYDPYRTKDSA